MTDSADGDCAIQAKPLNLVFKYFIYKMREETKQAIEEAMMPLLAGVLMSMAVGVMCYHIGYDNADAEMMNRVIDRWADACLEGAGDSTRFHTRVYDDSGESYYVDYRPVCDMNRNLPEHLESKFQHLEERHGCGVMSREIKNANPLFIDGLTLSID